MVSNSIKQKNNLTQVVFHEMTRAMSKFLLLLSVLLVSTEALQASNIQRLHKKAMKASNQFAEKASSGKSIKFKPDTVKIAPDGTLLQLEMNPTFAEIPFRPEAVAKYYAEYRKLLGRKFRKTTLTISSSGKEIGELVPNFYRNSSDRIDTTRLSVHKERPNQIVRNIFKNEQFSKGLANSNIALWPSHGWYYDYAKDRWEWQRARILLTVEDIWTLGFVVPYLTPMLENAGATVWLPRERDFGSREVIVDAERSSPGSVYLEEGAGWQNSVQPGFALKYPFLFDGENPFNFGHARTVPAKPQSDASVRYIPEIPETGNYAVYVSYSQNDQNAGDVLYTVKHAGGNTTFSVNQSIGGKTWIYLGTFKFEKGNHPENGMVQLTNASAEPGKLISADAVRFGGGVGNIVRGKEQQMKKLYDLREKEGWGIAPSAWIPFSSRRPRYQEAARYFLQYAGFPDSIVYNLSRSPSGDINRNGEVSSVYPLRESGMDDYRDDYMSRGEYVNYLMGDPNGPTKAPHAKGMGISMDLSMAFHTDAGTAPDSSIVGSLMIFDTTFERDTFPNGQSKWASRDLADIMQTEVVGDLQRLHKTDWTRRGLWNKPYFEAARPKVPAILSELLSHQNFADMYLAQDPRFKFDVCRALYKGILKFLSYQNGYSFVVQPLPVDHMGMRLVGHQLQLSWSPVLDLLEPSAKPAGFRVYTRIEDGGFDDGMVVRDSTLLLNDLKPGTIYSFKVSAFNEGGESFPSETLACSLPVDEKKPVLIVNGFDRICAPAAFDNGKQAGFLVSEDEGVSYHENVSYVGDQYDFDRNSPWLDDDASGFGSSYADQESRIVPGNSFDYPYVHGKSFRSNGYGFISMSDEAFERQALNPSTFSVVDLIFGKEKTTTRMIGFPGRDFTIFTPGMREALTRMANTDGAKILVSGAYVGSDLKLCGDSLARKFASELLHYTLRTNHGSKSGQIYTVNGWKKKDTEAYHYVNNWHPSIYKVESPDAIEPAGNGASVLFRYFGDNKSAGVCFNGKYASIVLGVPIEAISTDEERDALIGQLLRILNK